MFTQWLCTRPARSLKTDRPFRPSLETLEERNAPSGHGGGDDQGDHDHGPPHPVPVVIPAAGVNTSIATGVNAHGSFNNSTITGSFNTTNTVTNNVTVNLMPGQSAAVQGLMGLTNLLSTVLSNPQLGTLLNDEIIAAVDTFLTTPAISSALGLSSTEVSTLQGDLTTLQGDIAGLLGTPPSPILSALGTEVFTMTLNALTSPQNVI